MTVPTIDITWLTRLIVLVVAYYCVLYVLATRRRRARERNPSGRHEPGALPQAEPLVVLIIPAHNEEQVLGDTLRSLCALAYRNLLLVVMNDGSTDRTSEIARSFPSDRVLVVDRGAEIAGQGKGAVLNHAFRLVERWADAGEGRFDGVGDSSIVLGVMDADGHLEASTLSKVTPLFRDEGVGGVQIGVRIANAEDNWLTRMQDMEFVGFSGLVQDARNTFGSVGLGGNGQFARLSALRSLQADPWTDCLSEDLDLGLTLIEHGWQVRFCPGAFVAQQGLTQVRPLFRQRARWVQGHYQCWSHLPVLVRTGGIPVALKIDLSIYLTFITFVLLLGFGLLLSFLSWFGLVTLTDTFYDFVSDPTLHRLLILFVSFAPALMFVGVYQRNAIKPLDWYELPWFIALFAIYCYHWLVAQMWALARMLGGRRNWAKTPRVGRALTTEAALPSVAPAGAR